ncbi:MAG: hypothetical protein QF733_01975 [Phycisphaerales bacterium]|jgi:ABC-type transport system involved in multi-copper enzyme maturation permease subunit|nr:hypothetical protein [Phycisphaerales bacterium]
MTSILAILRESWLSLRAEWLFKGVMGLNVLVIVAYASIGFDANGISLFYGLTHIESEFIYAGSPMSRTLYLGIYSAFIVNMWLAWAASILALISTSSIFPSFLSAGAVELVVSRPTRRSTIFFVKYAGGLLFVVLQVSVFTLGAFLAAGWRVDAWDPAIFLAIPIITLFYSYLFCVNVLVGVITRSTLIALLATLLFWFSSFSVRTADDIMSQFSYRLDATVERTEARVAELDEETSEAEAAGDELDAEDAAHWAVGPQAAMDRARKAQSQLAPWAAIISGVRTVLPETARTLGLLHRALERNTDTTLMDLMSGAAFDDEDEPPRKLSEEEEAQARHMEKEEEIPAWSIILKSLVFEAVILIVALIIFRRRDF